MRRYVVGFLLLHISTPVAAFAQSSACTALLAQGIRDTSSTQITESRFNEIKSNVCNSNYDTYSKASSQAMNGGFDLPGVFGISAGSQSANSDYALKWSNFCQANYSRAMANADLRSFVSTANQSVLHSFDNCVNVTSEQFVRYVEPQPDGKTFSIVFKNKREGTTSFVISKISLTDATAGTLLSVKDNCDFSDALPFDTKPLNAFSIVCRKKADDTVIVSGITDAGNIDPVSVPAVPAAGPNIEDRVSALEGTTQSLQKALSLASANGDIIISRDDLTTFQSKHNDDGTIWKLCDGKPGTIDLTSRYPRGSGAGLPALGGQLDDAVGPHEHPITVPNAPANWSWQSYSPIVGGGDRTVLGAPNGGGIGQASIRTGNPDNPSPSANIPNETRPKTTIVNFFCRVS
jgi:hypothetical protein